jgi:(p)ppGpp synthase/HD superfamily hydrolase
LEVLDKNPKALGNEQGVSKSFPAWSKTIKMSDLVQKAKDFATLAHEGQVRKYTGAPYIVHPIEVMKIVQTINHDDIMLAGALLHDVVEDTDCTLDDIRAEFGEDVASLVADLTDVSKLEDGNRETRKAKDREHSAEASPSAQTVKLADLISNSLDIVKHDPSFAKVYMVEKFLLLGVLTHGDPILFERAIKLVDDYYESR